MNIFPERYMTTRQAAQYLHVSPKTLYRLVGRRSIPFIPLTTLGNGGKPALRFDRVALDAWMGRRQVKPISQALQDFGTTQ